MNKRFKNYLAVWSVLLVVFNVVAFVTPTKVGGFSKFDGAFWAGYIFITLALCGQLAVAYYASKEENIQKLFYKIPLITLSWSGMIAMFSWGGICMAYPLIPTWVGIIGCFVVLGVNVISVIKAGIAADIVSGVDEKIKVQTFFIKSLTVDAEGLVARAQTDESRNNCRKLFETVRYSDPMSHDALAGIESQITLKFAELTDAVNTGDDVIIAKLCKEVSILVEDRNRKCKILK